LPAERISNQGRSDPPGAKCLVHGYVGHRSRKRSVLTVNSDSSAPLNVIPRRPDCTIQQRSSAAWESSDACISQNHRGLSDCPPESYQFVNLTLFVQSLFLRVNGAVGLFAKTSSYYLQSRL